MLKDISPKLPMPIKEATKEFYLERLGLTSFGNDFEGYLMLQKDNVQIHFFEFKDLNPLINYGQFYIRTNDIDNLYQSFLKNQTKIHSNGHLQIKPWGQRKFSVLDPDHNLLTF